MLHFVYILSIFSFNTLDKGLHLLLQLKWLEWKNNGAELSTTRHRIIQWRRIWTKVQVLCCRWLNS